MHKGSIVHSLLWHSSREGVKLLSALIAICSQSLSPNPYTQQQPGADEAYSQTQKLIWGQF